MVRLVSEKYHIKDVLAYARAPWVYFKAPDILGPWKDSGVQNANVKSMGFSWECVKGTDFPKWDKTWVNSCKRICG